MTRTQITRQLEKLGINSAEDAVAAGVVAIQRIDDVGIGRVGQVDRAAAALLYSEFISTSSDDKDLWAASQNAVWMRGSLGLDNDEIRAVAEAQGWHMAAT